MAFLTASVVLNLTPYVVMLVMAMPGVLLRWSDGITTLQCGYCWPLTVVMPSLTMTSGMRMLLFLLLLARSR